MPADLAYLSKTPGIGGTLKSEPGDFIVDEIGLDGTVFESGKKVKLKGSENGDYTYFVLEKKNWTTSQAISEIARRLDVAPGRLSFAGTKDRAALTTQLACAYKLEPARLLGLDIKDISINGAWLAGKKLEMGELLGNRFVIKASSPRLKGARASARVAEIENELGGRFPNYFGGQRFGSVRQNTHIIGKAILLGRFQDAVKEYLAAPGENEPEQAKQARAELKQGWDYGKALQDFPHHLKYERAILEPLTRNPYDYVNALRRLPRTLSLMFVHAYQSHLFNLMLSERIKDDGAGLRKEEGEHFCATNAYGFPELDTKAAAPSASAKPAKGKAQAWLAGKLIGYETKLNKREKELLAKEEIRQDDFKVRAFPEINAKGGYRTLLAPFKDFRFDARKTTFSFSLPSGSYATSALREFLEEKN